MTSDEAWSLWWSHTDEALSAPACPECTTGRPCAEFGEALAIIVDQLNAAESARAEVLSG